MELGVSSYFLYRPESFLKFKPLTRLNSKTEEEKQTYFVSKLTICSQIFVVNT